MFQFEKITRLAQVVFQDEGKLALTGQGVLKRVFLSAYLSENGQRILPPREHFYFNRDPRMNTDVNLVRKVATYFILSEQKAQQQVELWEQSLMERARETGVKFGEFGMFTYDEQLDFLAETLLYYQSLPELPFHPVGSSLHDYPRSASVPIAHLPQETPSRRRELVPALWMLLIVLFGFAFYLWSGPLDAWINHKTEMDTRLVNVAPRSYQTDSSPEVYNDTDEMEEDLEMSTRSEEENSKSVVGGDAHEDIGNEEQHTEITDSEFQVPGRSSVPSNQQISESSSRCTLIVGAFANRGNVDRMLDRLEAYGVEVVTMERKTLTLVGAAVTCSNTDKMDILRSEIDPNAWIYKK